MYWSIFAFIVFQIGKVFFDSWKQKPADIKRPLHITDVEPDCIERVLEHLNVTDLSNAAHAHPHFVYAARLVYKRLYVHKIIRICESGRTLSLLESMEGHGQLIKADVKSFFENFGMILERVRLDYSYGCSCKNVRHWPEMEQFVTENCINSLTSIWLNNCSGTIIEDVSKSFAKVNTVYIKGKYSGITNVDVNRCFPNASHVFFDIKVIKYGSCLMSFLKSLVKIQFRVDKDTNSVARKNLVKILVFNSHIKDLTIESNGIHMFKCLYYGYSFLEFLSRILNNLHTLILINVDLESDDFKHIRFYKSLKHFSLEVHRSSYPDNVSISFDQLTSLELFGVKNDPKWINFILQNKNLTYLFYGSDDSRANSEELIQIVEGLPELKELIIENDCCLFWSDSFVELLTICAAKTNLKTIGKILSKRERRFDFYIYNVQNKTSLGSIFTFRFVKRLQRKYHTSTKWDCVELYRK